MLTVQAKTTDTQILFNLRITVSSASFDALVKMGDSSETAQEYNPEAEKLTFFNVTCLSSFSASWNQNEKMKN